MNGSKHVLVRRLIFLGLIVLAVAIFLITFFTVRYTRSRVNKNNIFEGTDFGEYKEVSNDMFLDYFQNFNLKSTSINEAYKNADGELVNGQIVFQIENNLRDGVSFVGNSFKVTFKAGLSGYNGKGYKSDASSETSITTNATKKDLKLDINEAISVNKLTIYVLAKWQVSSNDNTYYYYTILEYNYNDYHVVEAN